MRLAVSLQEAVQRSNAEMSERAGDHPLVNPGIGVVAV